MKSRRTPAAPQKPDVFPEGQVLSGCDATHLLSLGRKLEQYRFIGCELSGADLSGVCFEDCLFERCNLASVRLRGAALRNVAFNDCKLLGVAFSECEGLFFSAHFDECQLRYASFVGAQLAGTRFAHCDLTEADFTDADLRKVTFAECELSRAVFHHTRLLGADFTTATGFALDPETNPLKGARFSVAGLRGLLGKYGLVVE